MNRVIRVLSRGIIGPSAENEYPSLFLDRSRAESTHRDIHGVEFQVYLTILCVLCESRASPIFFDIHYLYDVLSECHCSRVDCKIKIPSGMYLVLDTFVSFFKYIYLIRKLKYLYLQTKAIEKCPELGYPEICAFQFISNLFLVILQRKTEKSGQHPSMNA